MFSGKSDRCGAVHITIGDGGNSEGLARRCVPLKLLHLYFKHICVLLVSLVIPHVNEELLIYLSVIAL